MKRRFISAYQWLYGATKAEASKAYARYDDESRKVIISIFENNAKKSFYED